MNCDRAFDLITSSTDRDDIALQQHLQSCPRCRDLVEMFEPALHLLDDSRNSFASSSESDGNSWSSEYFDDESAAPSASARRPHYESPEYWRAVEAQQRRRGYQDGLKVAAIMLLIAIFSVGLTIVGQERSTPLAQVAAMSTENCIRRDTDGKEIAPVLAACAACHLDEAESAKLSADAHQRVRVMLQRCFACHLDMKPTPTEIADIGATPSSTTNEDVWGHAAGPCLRLANGG